MAGYGMARSIVAPDNQRSHLIELHFVRSDTLARLRRLVVLNTVRGTGLPTQVARTNLKFIGEARRRIGSDITACHSGQKNEKQ